MYIFQKTNTCIKLFTYLKSYLTYVQTSRFSFLLLNVKHQFPYGDTSLSFQIRGWIYHANIHFFMGTITFISSIQKRRKNMAYQHNLQKPSLYVKGKYFFSLITRKHLATFHIQKTFSIFLWTSKKLWISDNQNKNICFPKATNTCKKCNLLKQNSKEEVYQSGIYNQKQYFVLYIQIDLKPVLWSTSTWTNVNLNQKSKFTKRKVSFAI